MTSGLELWGGPECTVNRVGDDFRDQFALSGHRRRIDDLDAFASLGIKAIRYPISWELSCNASGEYDWEWIDRRMERLRELDLRVVVGLVHHGGGPLHTDLLDDRGFSAGLMEHARRVAERYPWISDWTPVNEPLTTARFSALYGHWYPHRRDETAFWRALLNQIDAVRLAMEAVRTVNPRARLIQTDDLGRTFATAALRDQAGFDNVRRWATWDLLFGRVDEAHPLWSRLARLGLESRLALIAAKSCPPDVIGINHYLTSDRFLDHRLRQYPARTHGGNLHQRYADLEAVRVLQPTTPGLSGAIREAWLRYGTSLAITECHNGCTREEQLRWLAEAWDTAKSLNQEGIPVRAVTVWSLLGSFGWNTLLTTDGRYEPGVFDVSGAAPRETALGPLMRALTQGGERHPVTRSAGWWRRPARLEHPTVPRPAPIASLSARSETDQSAPPLLICGASGTLGQAFARACRARNIAYVLTARERLDLGSLSSIRGVLAECRPWAIVNAAGWVRVDEAEDHREACLKVNASGAIDLAAVAAEQGACTVSISSDLVFDGKKKGPYLEQDAPAPLNAYGDSKAQMERGLLGLSGRHLIIRTAAFFSPFDPHNFAAQCAGALARNSRFTAASDLFVSPTYVPHLVDVALDLLIDAETGIWHLTNGAGMCWSDLAARIAGTLGLPANLIDAVPSDTLGWRASRPRSAMLGSTRGSPLPLFEEALSAFGDEVRRHQTPPPCPPDVEQRERSAFELARIEPPGGL